MKSQRNGHAALKIRGLYIQLILKYEAYNAAGIIKPQTLIDGVEWMSFKVRVIICGDATFYTSRIMQALYL
jgi:hypothetical protein